MGRQGNIIRQIIKDYFGECSPTYQLLDSQTLQIQAELSPRKKQRVGVDLDITFLWTKFFRTIPGTLEESAKQLDNGEDVIY